MANSNLSAAKRAKNDEFYTQLTDIEKELRKYKKHFRGKTVLCNCDDPFESNFFKYFVLNFNHLGLKKLIATCYEGSAVAEYRDGKAKPYKAVVTAVHDTTGDGGVTMDDVRNLFESGENELTELEGDGDFRSEECLALLEEADVVVTNPPFSLFREYVATLMEYGKKFIAIGSQNAITYKEFFPLLKNDEVWPGVTHPKEFVQRNGEIKKFGNICWFTNLDIRKRHEELILVKKYAGHEDEYPKYDNYDAIEVSKVVNIPLDYAGVMGVPITFLDKYSPDQFEIVGLTQRGCHDESLETKIYDDYWEMRPDGTRTGSSGNKTNGNPNLAMNDGKHNYFVNAAGHVVQSCYQRILIRNKHPEK
ncbi:adenine-specific methyltransferase EcoRI family protein [Bifidobacterium animalis]|uniref:Restriction endonuclease subunit M n=1 Tax=Bifidobacterium animalis subsp. lactis TaxID=302911 RepID=A0A8B3RHX5_BIFAN|nr:adenine-specific methyltransferase EcoRI family protein [Bifidobacterium animalis]RYM95314.1 restriction endonuclease subunit M [Bifidobacterium animalis subsp. lactis]